MIQRFLDRYTMYKVVLLALIILVISGFFVHQPLNYSLSILTFLVASYLFNRLFSLVFRVTANSESWLISALILICLFDPPLNFFDFKIIIIASFLTQASKYLLVYRHAHIFNPVAISVFILTLFGVGNATWWIGSAGLFPLVLILGYLVVLKVRRQHLFLTFIISSYLFSTYFISGLTIFFACFMLTEPSTTPPTRKSQILYALLAAFLYVYYFDFALVSVNLLFFLFFSRQRLSLKLVSLKKITTNIYDLCFQSDFKLKFKPGQYLEWTVPHSHPDFRGNRRWFSVASSPTEKDIHLGISIPANNISTLKQSLLVLQPGDLITAHQAQGDFVLPRDSSIKLAFIAGGIGVTPFRSMIKYLIDTKSPRNIILIYAGADDTFAYQDVFNQVKAIYHNTQKSGRLTREVIVKSIPDFRDRHFYISGPGAMVDNYQKLLKTIGVHHIHTDYFPGF